MKQSVKRCLPFLFIVFSALTAVAGDTTKLKTLPHPVADEAGLVLPEGFKATKVIESLGKNRHIVMNSNGDLYVKLEKLKSGKGIVVLRTSGAGKAKIVNSFGDFTGTGIAIKNGYLYASSDEEVFRYKFNEKNEIS